MNFEDDMLDPELMARRDAALKEAFEVCDRIHQQALERQKKAAMLYYTSYDDLMNFTVDEGFEPETD